MSPSRKEREQGRKKELPLGRGVREKKHFRLLEEHGQKEIGRKRSLPRNWATVGAVRDRLPIWEGLPTGNWVCSSCLYN